MDLLKELTRAASNYKNAIGQGRIDPKYKNIKKRYKNLRESAYNYLIKNPNNQNIRGVIINVETFKNPRSGIMYEGGRAAGRRVVNAARRVGWGPNTAPNGNTRAINRLGAGFRNTALSPEALKTYTNALKRITFARVPEHSDNINVIMKSIIEILNSKVKFANKPKISKRIGAALGRIIDKILSTNPRENEGAGQPTKEGAIIGEFFRGLLSQDKEGTIRWLSRFLGGKIGNRHIIGKELEKIITILAKNPKTRKNGENFKQSVLNLYKVWPERQGNRGPKQKVGNRFINGIIDPGIVRFGQAVANVARRVQPVIRAVGQARPQTASGLGMRAAAGILRNTPGLATGVAGGVYQGAKRVGNILTKQNRIKLKNEIWEMNIPELNRLAKVYEEEPETDPIKRLIALRKKQLEAIRNGGNNGRVSGGNGVVGRA